MMLASAPPATAAVALVFFLFFFNDTATTEIYTLSLHDALPIWFSPPLWTSTRQVVQDALPPQSCGSGKPSVSAAFRIEVFGATSPLKPWGGRAEHLDPEGDRKSTRLNSSHVRISYAVFCLKKKKESKNSH